MVTIKDVAKRAGVSHGTVSNILNGSTNVKLENVKKVEAAIKELGYRRDNKARGLKMSTSMNIGVVIPNIIDRHFAMIYEGIESSLSQKGYNVYLHLTKDIAAIEENAINKLIEQRIDGIILVSCNISNEKIIKRFDEQGIKSIFVDREPDYLDVNFVGSDYHSSLKQYISSQLKKGINKIALITGDLIYSSENDCYKAYIDAFNENHEKVQDKLIRQTIMNKENAFRDMIQLFQYGEVPEVVITSSSLLMDGVLKAQDFLDFGYINKPKLASFGEDTWTKAIDADVEVFLRKSFKIGNKAADLLVENINNPKFFDKSRILLNTSKKTKDQIEINQKKDGINTTLKVLLLKSTSGYATYALLNDFRSRTKINVELTMLDYKELYEEVVRNRKENKYDVIQYDVPWLEELAEYGDLLKLDNMLSDKKVIEDKYIDGSLKTYGKFETDIYGLPYMYGIQLLYYRKDLFEDIHIKRRFYEIYKTNLLPPKTWLEFNEVAKFFTKEFNKDSPVEYGTTLGGKFSSGAVCEYLPRMFAFNKKFSSADSINLYKRENIIALENYKESYKYAPPKSEDFWWDEQVEVFSSGKAAMMILFNAHVADIVDPSKSEVAGKIGYDVVPGGRPLIGGWGLGITNHSNSKEEALKFIQWACGEEIALPFTILGGTPAIKSLYSNSELLQVYPWYKLAKNDFANGKKRVLPRSSSNHIIPERKYEEILGEAIYGTITNKLSADEALKIANDKLQLLIEKY